LKEPLPPVLHPGTKEPVGPDDLSPLFPMELIKQEVSTDPQIIIPDQVRDIYRLYRPTPLYRARSLEKALKTPAKIFYKYEGVSPTGSHKPNTAIPQAYYNKMEGVDKITTETGAGQWGSSLAFACSKFDIDLDIYMVKVSYDQKPYRKAMMETFGARCIASPSLETEIGRKILAETPDSTGSLGIAISEAVEMCVGSSGTKYALGSVLNHVLTHQTIIGQEAMQQMSQIDENVDIVVGCTGGGSNFSGIAMPFLGKAIRNNEKLDLVAVEPSACPTLTKGKYAYDFGDTGQMTPLTKMHTLGSQFVPSGFHAGGLRYHGMAPIISHLVNLGYINPEAYRQNEIFKAGVLFAKTEGIIPAPEANHAVKGAIEAALRCKESGESRTILFNLCGHGHFDMQAYLDFFEGKLFDQDYSDEEIGMALSGLPSV
jgi:tryptophan synthase beta chain